MPRQWAAPTLYVRLPDDVKLGDPAVELAKQLVTQFAIRIYDAFDGQVYIPEFVICNPSVARERETGMCNLFQSGSVLYRNEAFSGSPLKPGFFYCVFPVDSGYVGFSAGTMLHEWLHAFIGLGDEYKLPGELGNNMTTSCPLNPTSIENLDGNACVMYLSRTRRELCRPQNHNPKTDQGKEDCYTTAVRVLFENRLAFIRVPDRRIEGPFNPPTPKITIKLK